MTALIARSRTVTMASIVNGFIIGDAAVAT